ncbi:zinc ribbon domain-containing protein [Leucobacter sp. USCH14]|uniref:FmdB family zinc ribbon protein n=1 Tax=Leucobacter sp. USCH14 TaxID=3024838 RepID=UPI0030962682
MPTYAYRCSDCGHAFDIYQAFTDSSLTECPECGGTLRKVFGSLGVTFNGSGFYRTDSRSSGGSKAGSGSDAKKSDSGSKAGSGSSVGSGSGSSSTSSSAGSSSSN